jgi:hypothetical protein
MSEKYYSKHITFDGTKLHIHLPGSIETIYIKNEEDLRFTKSTLQKLANDKNTHALKTHIDRLSKILDNHVISPEKEKQLREVEVQYEWLMFKFNEISPMGNRTYATLNDIRALLQVLAEETVNKSQ